MKKGLKELIRRIVVKGILLIPGLPTATVSCCKEGVGVINRHINVDNEVTICVKNGELIVSEKETL